MPPDSLDERCRRRVNDDSPNRQLSRQTLQLGVVFLVRELAALFAAVVVILPDTIPSLPAPAPQAHTGGVGGAVVHGDIIPVIRAGRRRDHMNVLVEHGVNQPLGHDPKPPDVSVIEHTLVLALIPLPDGRRQRWVIVHGEVDVQRVLLPRLVPGNPVLVKPVFGSFRVAVEPVPAPLDRATGQRLVHKGLRLQGHLVQQNACQRDTLDQCIAGLVPAAEQEIGVLPPAAIGDYQLVLGPALNDAQFRRNPVP